MGNNNISKFMLSFGKHATNINRTLKNIKSEIMTNFVHANHYGLIIRTIRTNKIASQSDLSIIENYIKNVYTIKYEDIMISCLSQSKS